MEKKKRNYKCSICGIEGHKKNSCPNNIDYLDSNIMKKDSDTKVINELTIDEDITLLKPKISARLVKNTLMGSSILAFESAFGAKRLREDVTSPGGTTEAALAILEDKKQFSKIIDIAIQSAIKRSIDLS